MGGLEGFETVLNRLEFEGWTEPLDLNKSYISFLEMKYTEISDAFLKLA